MNIMHEIDFVSPFQGSNLFLGHETQGVALGYPVMRFQRLTQPAEDQTNPRPETLVESVFNLFAKKL